MIVYIGFCGKAGVGKTTACNILRELHDGPSVILPWACELKRIAKEEFGWGGEKDEKGRKLLQTLGTECGRMYGGDLFWVNKWQQKTDEFIESHAGDVLILNDDTRFGSEAERIKEKGTLVELFGRELDLGVNASHSSEAGIDNKYIDRKLDNSGSIEELKSKMENFLEQITDTR